MTWRAQIRIAGFSLIELMVALAIGSFLIAGAVVVYSNSRKTYTINESTARLEENARFIFSMIEPDLQLAGYYGFSNIPDGVKFISGGSTAAPTPVAQMTPADPLVPVGGTAQSCGPNFPVNLLATVEGPAVNNTYSLACPAQGGGARANTDTLTIRRVGLTALPAAVPGRLQLLSSRLSATGQFLISDGGMPPSPTLTLDLVELRDLIVNTYYISVNSTSRPGIPALRLKALTNGPSFDDDREIMAGVEDLQIQFGIDDGDYDGDGIIDPINDTDGNGIPDAPLGIATRYVNPGSANLNRYQIVSVRIWLMLRAEQLETGFTDNKVYTYAGKVVTPNDNFRRLLVTRTIQLRNSRTL